MAEEKGLKVRSTVDDLPDRPLDRIEDVSAKLKDLQSRCNIVSPFVHVDHIMPMHQISLRAVMIDPSVDGQGNGPECYRDPRFCAADEVAIGKVGLAKLMAAAGVQTIQRRRLDDRSNPNYCEIEMTLGVQDWDGSWRQAIATKEIDLRPGSPETMKPEKGPRGEKTGKLVPYEDTALADKRRHIQSLCETKAVERGLRLLFSLRQKYKALDFKRPFIVPKLVANLDPNDPETKTALLAHALEGEARLFGQPRGEHGTRVLRAISEHHRSTDPMRSLAAPQDAPAAPQPTPREYPEPEDAGLFALDADLSEFELPATETAEEPSPIVCGCPCGDQTEVSDAVASATLTRVGSIRCQACFPGKAFDDARHKGVKALGLNLFPTWTPDRNTWIMAKRKS